MAITETPTSANTAAHILAKPTEPRIKMTILTVSAKIISDIQF